MSKSTNSDNTITDRVSESAHQSANQIGKTARKAKQRLSHEAGRAKTGAKDVSHRAKQRSEETLHAVGNFVGDNPATSLGLAFAAGTLVSYLIKR